MRNKIYSFVPNLLMNTQLSFYMNLIVLVVVVLDFTNRREVMEQLDIN